MEFGVNLPFMKESGNRGVIGLKGRTTDSRSLPVTYAYLVFYCGKYTATIKMAKLIINICILN